MQQFAEIHRNTLTQLCTEGYKNLHFIDGFQLLGQDYSECSVDTCHISDMGFYRIAEALHPELTRILTE